MKKGDKYNELALFAGAGGGILGGLLHGWRTVAAVEIEDYPRRVLLQRQADGILPKFPIWDDVCTFDGKPWRGKVDVISGGFPCQDISAAGKGEGITGERSGLWKEMARIISEVRPEFVFVENSPLLISRGLETVLSDLAQMGYNAEWCIVSAKDCGAPHKRDRIWIKAECKANRRSVISYTRCISSESGGKQAERDQGAVFDCSRKRYFMANPKEIGFNERSLRIGNQKKNTLLSFCGSHVAYTVRNGTRKRLGEIQKKKIQNTKRTRRRNGPELGNGCQHRHRDRKESTRNYEWPVEPVMGRVANGVAHRVDRIKALGNGQVPRVAATAWEILR